MRRWLARLCRRWAEWLDPVASIGAPDLLVSIRTLVASDLFVSAQRTVLLTEPLRHTGAFKRAVAMKTLRGLHPSASRRALSLALELALQATLPTETTAL